VPDLGTSAVGERGRGDRNKTLVMGEERAEMTVVSHAEIVESLITAAAWCCSRYRHR